VIESKISKNSTKSSGTIGKNSDNREPRKKLANHQSIANEIFPIMFTALV
jgi:hypothetical protein